MNIEEMTLVEILEYIKNNLIDENTNLYMRCLDCDEYVSLSDIDLEIETCHNCNEED